MRHLAHRLGLAAGPLFLNVFLAAGIFWWLTGNGSPFRLGNLVEQQAKREQVLEVHLKAIKRCAREKSEVARAVAEGKLTLQEGVQEFRRLHRERDQILGAAADPNTPHDEEDIARNVLEWVRLVVKDDRVLAGMTTAEGDARLPSSSDTRGS
jgi:hypothetical protein